VFAEQGYKLVGRRQEGDQIDERERPLEDEP